MEEIKTKKRYSKIEFICAISALLWGAWILYPVDSFQSASAYHLMGNIASECVWGMGMTLIGIIQILFIIIGSLKMRKTIAVIGMFIWATIAITFLFGNALSTAASSAISFFVVNAFAFSQSDGRS
jgi:hypothetical protein